MAKVVLSGYYGFDNIGDEAILLSIIQALMDVEPGIDIIVLSNNPARTSELYGVEAVNRWKLSQVAGALKQSDMLISGGGSLLQDVTGIKSLAYYLGVVTLARSLGKPVFFYAQGIGPVNTALGRRLMKTVVNRVQAITVRDEPSKQDLLAMGVKVPVTVTADPVLGLTLTEDHNVDTQKPVLGVSVRSWHGDVRAFQRELANCCDYYARQNWQVMFLPLHHPGDQEACQQVAKLMKEESSMPVDNLTVHQFMGLISRCSMLVGMRLHSLIMAAAAGVPVVGVSYDPKIDRFMQQLGLTPACHVNNPNCSILPELERVSADLDGERERLKEKVNPLKESARHTAHLAINYLQNP